MHSFRQFYCLLKRSMLRFFIQSFWNYFQHKFFVNLSRNLYNYYICRLSNIRISGPSKETQNRNLHMDRKDEEFARRLQEKENLRSNALSQMSSDYLFNPAGNFEGYLLVRSVPADNSCLFSSIRFVLNGGLDNEDSSSLRNLIAQEVAADPHFYNLAFLGKTNAEYCEWIQRPESWGGAIELSILANFYSIEIDVIDVQHCIISRFGEDRNYSLRVFVHYDGMHYDPVYLDRGDGNQLVTIFPIEEMGVYRKALQMINDVKARIHMDNQGKYPLRCSVCNGLLLGPNEAKLHTQTTGHNNFEKI